MSAETMLHLNTNVLVGNTDARGNAWHWRADLQGMESNHYTGAIPVADVVRRLFNWKAESRRVAVEVPADFDTMTHLNDNGMPMRWDVQTERQAITHGQTHQTFELFKAGYAMHQYEEWLLQYVSNMLGDSLGVSSAGLLKGGAIAWVEVSVPDSINTPQGVTFRPNLLATTSFDGSCATTYKRTLTDTVCDNTRAIAMSEASPTYKVRHSKGSKAKVLDARQALAMVHQLADDFAAEIAAACAMQVTTVEFNRFMDLAVPLTKDGTKLEGRSKTMADNKRDQMLTLWRNDKRVAPWAGTAHGVIQMVNTWAHHDQTVRNATRAERNQLNTIGNEWENLDRETWSQLQQAMAGATAVAA
jgi:phage/plasmid-like protein (TIGR03299 family)